MGLGRGLGGGGGRRGRRRRGTGAERRSTRSHGPVPPSICAGSSSGVGAVGREVEFVPHFSSYKGWVGKLD